MLPDPSLTLEFDDEMLVAKINIVAYRKIYTLEGWLRRICAAAWMANFGALWAQELDAGLRRSIENRMVRNRQRLYLGAESYSDVIWQATHGELLQMLTASCVSETIKSLTGAEPTFLKAKLDEIREIRNLLAHNHALSQRTYTILAGLLAALEDVVETFKACVLYASPEIFMGDDHPVSSLLERLLAKNDWSKFQAFVARKGHFLEYWSLPANLESRPDWPDAERLLRSFSNHLDNIIAFCLNKQGGEFGILTPVVIPASGHEALCEDFVKHRDAWTNVRFEDQDPRFICSAKIWFYENSSPLRYRASAPLG